MARRNSPSLASSIYSSANAPAAAAVSSPFYMANPPDMPFLAGLASQPPQWQPTKAKAKAAAPKPKISFEDALQIESDRVFNDVSQDI